MRGKRRQKRKTLAALALLNGVVLTVLAVVYWRQSTAPDDAPTASPIAVAPAPSGRD